MKTLLYIFPIVLLAAACGSEESQDPATTEVFERTINVSTERVQPQEFVNYLSLVGTVKSGQDIRVSAEVTGLVERLSVQKGQRFKKGDLILKIDDSSLRQELEIATASAETAQENYERTKSLWESDRIGSEFAVITAANASRQAQANKELLEIRLQKSSIIAQFDGILEDVYVEQGEIAAAGSPLVRLIESGRMHIESGVPARYAGLIGVGDPIEISFEMLNNRTYTSKVSRVGSAIDPSVRTFRIEADLQASSVYKVDMIATIRLQTETFADAIVLNQEFVQRDENGYRVFVVSDVDGKKRATATRVELGPIFNNRVVITSGLEPGDEVITRGSVFVENNILLNIQNEEANS
jgi:RND family efflux transporter MFP subunit